MTKALTVAIIGARTVRQGTGPWFAKHFATAGAEVCAVLGSSSDSAESAKQELADRFDINTSAFSDWDTLLDTSNPDLIAIATPAHTHREFLLKAHAAGKPVFVEKPFIWDTNRNNHTDTQELVSIYKDSQLPLYVNTQWLETLDEFSTIYPECDLGKVEEFEMLLSPVSQGAEMLVDALPHAWNMLVHLAGAGEAAELNSQHLSSSHIKVSGIFEGERATTKFCFDMRQCPEQPRPFGYAINGDRVDRVIEPATYGMSFAANGKNTPIRDPLVARIARILTLVSENAYNSALERQPLETRLLEQSIEVLSA